MKEMLNYKSIIKIVQFYDFYELGRRISVVKTRTTVREIPGSILTIYEFSVWKESGAPPYKCARALLVFSK